MLMIWLCDYTAQGGCDPMPILWNYLTEMDCQQAGTAFVRSNPQCSVALACVRGSTNNPTQAQPLYPLYPIGPKATRELNEPGLPKFSNDDPHSFQLRLF